MEESKNVFLAIKASVVFAAGCFTAAFGWLGVLVLAWVVCMALDWVTGTMKAAKNKDWNSARANRGIFHKAGMIAVVLVAAIADFVLGALVHVLPIPAMLDFRGFVTPLVLVWLIVTELGSILENAVAMGAPCPKFLKKILKIVSATVEKAGGEVVANIPLEEGKSESE